VPPLALGLHEFAGYLAVGITAFLAGYLAGHGRAAKQLTF
jgi:hypothetical protein